MKLVNHAWSCMACLVACALAACSSQVNGAAGIEILSESNTALSMRFTAANSQTFTLAFSRSGTSDFWKAETSSLTTPGIVFGNTSSSFGKPSTLRSLGITADMAIKTFSSSIAQRPLNDVTIYRLHAEGEMAVALWQSGVITEIWHVGDFVDSILGWPALATACQRAKARCCRTTAYPPDTTPVPTGSHAACLAVLANCPGLVTDVCDCLNTACEFCETHQAYCLAHPTVDQFSGQACATHLSNCYGQLDSSQGFVQVVAMLGESLDRIQAIIDTQ